mgnify:FL=1
MTMFVQTMLLVPLIPHGVLQLGSLDVVCHVLDHLQNIGAIPIYVPFPGGQNFLLLYHMMQRKLSRILYILHDICVLFAQLKKMVYMLCILSLSIFTYLAHCYHPSGFGFTLSGTRRCRTGGPCEKQILWSTTCSMLFTF